MASLADIMLALKLTLEGIDGLTAYSVEPASPKYPAAWPFLRSADYLVDFDDAVTWHLAVTVAVDNTEPGRAQSNLYPYLAPSGAKSIKAILEADPGLGLVGVNCAVRGVLSVGVANIGGKQPMIAQFDCEVYG